MKRTLLLLLFSLLVSLAYYTAWAQSKLQVDSLELISYDWGCLNKTIDDSLVLEQDSIILIKYGKAVNDEFILLDSTYNDAKSWEFDFQRYVLVIDNTNFLTATESKRYLRRLYKPQQLTWVFDKKLQLLKITAIDGKRWDYYIYHINENKIILLKHHR